MEFLSEHGLCVSSTTLSQLVIWKLHWFSHFLTMVFQSLLTYLSAFILETIHWLFVPQHIQFKILALVRYSVVGVCCSTVGVFILSLFLWCTVLVLNPVARNLACIGPSIWSHLLLALWLAPLSGVFPCFDMCEDHPICLVTVLIWAMNLQVVLYNYSIACHLTLQTSDCLSCLAQSCTLFPMVHNVNKGILKVFDDCLQCGVISPRYDVKVKNIESWTTSLLPSRQFGWVCMQRIISVRCWKMQCIAQRRFDISTVVPGMNRELYDMKLKCNDKHRTTGEWTKFYSGLGVIT